MRTKRIFFMLLLSSSLLVSCVSAFQTPVTDIVRADAYHISFKYIGMGYAWGGQDFWYVENGVVDCSGLVVNIYKEACENHNCRLLFEDTTASVLYANYTIPITTPRRGDLIFMGDDGVVSHVAIFHQFVDDRIEFLDAHSVSKVVGIRQYPASDSRFISFGRMIIR